jgi:hypothetical protein
MLRTVDEAAYVLYQSIHGTWARRRHHEQFERVSRFCLFAGYPRSGHSLVGALLNAHKDAVIAHELDAQNLIVSGCPRDTLYARILARASWFNLRGNTSNYRYQVPNQWQGRFDALRVLGDKRGGGTSRCLVAHPDLLERTRALVRIPLRVVHVVRNPFDNIAAISIWNEMSLERSIEFYFHHCDATTRLDSLCDRSELLTVYHEDMIREPRRTLASLCAFLGLDPDPGYLDDCCSIVFRQPTYTRSKLDWKPALVHTVETRARAHRFLDGYTFELPGDRRPAA